MNFETSETQHQPAAEREPQQRTHHDGGGWRETIESIVIALVLAFLFRTFEAEAFVIPTGSMATTLMGRHKDVECPECGIEFKVNASDEVDNYGRIIDPTNRSAIRGGICPNCNYKMSFENADGKVTAPSYKGDRILVGKQAYATGDPQRWDVVVFRYPHGAATNYIKRLVGLPNETVQIAHGDVLVRTEDGDNFKIARKPPEKVAALLRGVHNNDNIPSRLQNVGWPPRWSPFSPDGSPTSDAGWISSEGHRKFSIERPTESKVWLAYHHLIPPPEVWESLEQNMPWATDLPKPQLITDRTAYNSPIAEYEDSSDQNESKGMHWVGDLAIECTVDVQEVNQGGSLTFVLIEGGRQFQCVFNLNKSTVRLAIDAASDYSPTAEGVDLTGAPHRIRFANVDDQLLLWVDETLVLFDTTTAYASFDRTVPTAEDLTPVRIGARETKLTIDHLEVKRDIYYIADRQSRLSDYIYLPFAMGSQREIAEFFSTPELWPKVFDEQMRTVEFTLESDQFFVLGDNSARSQDGRLWGGGEHFFDRDLMIGKALMIYWPHSWETSFSVPLPGTEIRVPFYPNFSRMGRVR